MSEDGPGYGTFLAVEFELRTMWFSGFRFFLNMTEGQNVRQ